MPSTTSNLKIVSHAHVLFYDVQMKSKTWHYIVAYAFKNVLNPLIYSTRESPSVSIQAIKFDIFNITTNRYIHFAWVFLWIIENNDQKSDSINLNECFGHTGLKIEAIVQSNKDI